MITNKDISIDSENGKITLNGNKYDLGTQGEIDTAVKGVYSVMGQNGAKNLIPYPYVNTSQTINNVEFTVNGDGSISADNAASATTQFRLYGWATGLSPLLLRKGTYILSGCPSGGGVNSLRLYLHNQDSSINIVDDGEGTQFTLSDDTYVGIAIRVANGYDADGKTVYPMLRLASDTDNTYQPYAKTNKQLTETIGDLTQTGVTGASVAAQIEALNTTITDVDAYTVSDITDVNQSITVNEFSLRKCGKIVTLGLNFNASDAIAQFTNLFKLPSGIESFGRIDAVGIFATSTPNIARLTVDDNGYVVANSAIAAASYYLGAIVFICDED